MTWYPNRRRPLPGDYRDTSPPILDWVSGEYTAPRNPDSRTLEAVAKSIARQFADKTRGVKRAKAVRQPSEGKSPP
jgi:hypothetical protein